jgi:hypothetical protein
MLCLDAVYRRLWRKEPGRVALHTAPWASSRRLGCLTGALHAADEIVSGFAIGPYAADAPLHVIMLRTAAAKYAVYANGTSNGIELLPAGQQSELYD